MAENSNNIQFQIVVNTEGSEKNVTTLKQDINSLQAAIEKASKTGLDIKIDGFQRNIDEAKTMLDELKYKLESLNASHGTGREKVLNQELKITQALAKEEQKAADAYLESRRKIEAAERRTIINPDNVEMLRQQFAAREEIQKANERIAIQQQKEYYGRQFSSAKDSADVFSPQNTQLLSYQQQLSNLNKLQQQHWQLWKNTGDEVYKIRFNGVGSAIEKINGQMKEFKQSVSDSDTYLGSFGQKLRSHFNWILAGTLITTLAAVPAVVVDTTKETETLGLKIKQNLELADRYRENQQGLESDVKHLTDVAGVFAVGYGANVKDVMDMMQVLSRRFKSPEELTYYTNLAMIMSKLDFVEPKKAAEDLEAVILSMGLDFNQARQFIDQFSVAVHVARITGTELLSGLQRSGATFKNMNFNTAEAIAMISTLSTVTAKAGANIGASLNSIMINIDFKKAAQALHAYNIEVYDATSGKMRDGVEIWREIAKVFNGLDNQKANEFANAMSGGKFRANDLRALLSNWQTFEKILDEINTKASPDETTKLLQTGLDSFNTNLQRLMASLQIFGITIGNEVMPSLQKMVVGLTEGVQWLNEHREAVGTAIGMLGKFVEALILYRGWQFIANTQVGTFIGVLQSAISLDKPFATAMETMGTSAKGLATSIAAASIQLIAFLTVAQMLTELAGAANQSKAEKEYLNNLPYGGMRSVKEVDEIQQLIQKRDARADLPGDFNVREIDSLNQQIRQKLAEKKAKEQNLSQVNKMVEEATRQMALTPHGTPVPNEPVEGQNTGTPKIHKGSSGEAYANPPDSAEQRKRIEIQSEYKRLLADMQVSANKYSESLDDLNSKESIYGNTVALTNEKYDLMIKRIQGLTGEQKKLQDQKDAYQSTLDDYLEKDKEFQSVAASTIDNWGGMDKGQRKSYLLQNREGMQDFKTLKTLLDTISELDVKIAETSKNTSKLQNQWQKDFLGDSLNPDKQRDRRLEKISTDESIANTQVDKYDPLNYQDKTNIAVAANEKRLAEYKTAIDETKAKIEQLRVSEVEAAEDQVKLAEAMPDSTAKTEALAMAAEALAAARRGYTKAIQDEIDKLDRYKAKFLESHNKVVEESQKTAQQVRQYQADMFKGWLLDGTSFGDSMKKIINDLATDAINGIFRTGREASSATKMFGKGKSGGQTTTPSASGGKKGNGGKNAAGSVVNVPSIAGEDGEEVIVPTEKNTQNSGKLIDYAIAKTGYTPQISEYEPYFKNAELAKQPIINIQQRQNDAHLRAIETQNQLVAQQNQMIAQSLASGSGSPTIVMTQVSSDQVLEALRQNPGALNDILGRNNNRGYR